MTTASHRSFIARLAAAACSLVVAGLLGNPIAAEPVVDSGTTAPDSVKVGKHIEHPYLWVIERTPPCFLFGTIHVPDARVTRVPPMVLSAMSASDSVYTEVPLDLLSQTSAGLKVFDLTGPGLRGQLPEDVYARAERLVTDRGMSMAPFEKMKVWAFMSTLPMLDYFEDAKAGGTALDAVIYSRGSRLKKKVGGIETIDEQFGYFEGFSLEDQVHLLEKGLTQLEKARATGEKPMEELLDAYMSADTEELMTFALAEMDLDDPIEKRFFDDILIKRNELMAERVAAKMRQHPDRAFFFAFGVLHFPGEKGIVDLLEKDGWTVTRATPGTEFAPRPTATPAANATPDPMATSTVTLPRSKQPNPFAP